jgi:hypothetical protein
MMSRRTQPAGEPSSVGRTVRGGKGTGESTVKFAEAAERVIALARKIRAYWEVELPKRHPDYPLIHIDDKPVPQPPEYAKLEEFLKRLPPEMIYQLLLVMHLGRGDFGTANLGERFDELKITFGTPERVISQLTQKAALGDYLAVGLDKLKNSKIDMNKLSMKASRSRK